MKILPLFQMGISSIFFIAKWIKKKSLSSKGKVICFILRLQLTLDETNRHCISLNFGHQKSYEKAGAVNLQILSAKKQCHSFSVHVW